MALWESKWTGVAVKVTVLSLSVAFSFQCGRTYESHTTIEAPDSVQVVTVKGDSIPFAVHDTTWVERVRLVPGPPSTTYVVGTYLDTIPFYQTVTETVTVKKEEEPAPEIPDWLWRVDPRRPGD